MPDDSRDLVALASQNERLVELPGARLGPADASLGCPAPPRWAELASQRERLADCGDPLFGLASSRVPASGRRQRATDLRRVAGHPRRAASRAVAGAA
jgi:hypothetical protein